MKKLALIILLALAVMANATVMKWYDNSNTNNHIAVADAPGYGIGFDNNSAGWKDNPTITGIEADVMLGSRTLNINFYSGENTNSLGSRTVTLSETTGRETFNFSSPITIPSGVSDLRIVFYVTTHFSIVIRKDNERNSHARYYRINNYAPGNPFTYTNITTIQEGDWILGLAHGFTEITPASLGKVKASFN